MSREQKLVDLCFDIALFSAEHLHFNSTKEIAEWVAKQLRICGFPTQPCGASWGVLINE